MIFALVIRHAPVGYEGPRVTAHVTDRVQRLWFPWWQLRALWRARSSARAMYGPERVSIERW